MQHVLVDLRYEKTHIFNKFIKCNFCNFTLLMPPTLDAPPLCTPLYVLKAFETYYAPFDQDRVSSVSYFTLLTSYIAKRQAGNLSTTFLKPLV